jgi:hypothetical protein
MKALFGCGIGAGPDHEPDGTASQQRGQQCGRDLARPFRFVESIDRDRDFPLLFGNSRH